MMNWNSLQDTWGISLRLQFSHPIHHQESTWSDSDPSALGAISPLEDEQGQELKEKQDDHKPYQKNLS